MKLSTATTYKRTVKGCYPHPDKPDDTVPFQFVGEFRILKDSELKKMKAEAQAAGAAEDGEKIKGLLERVMPRVHGVENEAGEPMDPAEASAAVCGDVFYAMAAMAAWRDSLTHESKRKN
jgi:hypothetical protein